MRDGLLLGWTPADKKKGFREAVWDEAHEGHLMTIAPTGAGKGVSSSMPACLTWQGPLIVIDPKGEHYAVTARRRRELGQPVYVLDPFEVTDARESHALNPLDLYSETPTVDTAAMIASLIVQERISHKDVYWDERSQSLITDAIVHACRQTLVFDKNLHTIQQLIAKLAAQSERHVPASAPSSAIDILAAGFNPPGYATDRTRACILSSACSHLAFLSKGQVAASLGPSSLALKDIRDGVPLTLYIVLPPDKFASHGRLIRLWLGTLFAVLASRRTRPARSTLILFDEPAQFGTLAPLRTALTLMRSYGVRVWTFWQDLSQLRSTYPDWTSLMNNTAVLQQFGVPSPFAAAELESYYGAYLPKPVYDLRPDEMILTRSGLRPVLAQRPSYLVDALFAGQFGAHPMHREPLPHIPRDQPALLPFRRQARLPFPAQR